MSKPKVSVIIPTHNSENTIKQCIESITQDSIPRDDYEIIIVDDGSLDKTVDIAKSCGADAIIQTEPCFQGKARNIGAKRARAELLAFIDSDCEAKKGWLGSIIKNLPEKKAMTGPIENGNPQSKEAWAEYFVEFGGFHKYTPKSEVRFMPGCNQAITKDIFLQTEGFAEHRSSEDVQFGESLRGVGVSPWFVPSFEILHLCRTDMQKVKSNMKNLGKFTVRTRKSNPQIKYGSVVTCRYFIPIVFFGKLAKCASYASGAKMFGRFLSSLPLVVSAVRAFCSGISEELSK